MQATSEAWFHPEPTGTARPPGRCFHCGAVAGTRAYVFGGRAPAKGTKLDLLNDLWCLNTVRPKCVRRGVLLHAGCPAA